ncbi:MAG: histidinol-phosphate transaminase [Thaumarchaeota archaeon]|nr:histidinol-phosphate transaminase [Nitrososphaerota archaeon]
MDANTSPFPPLASLSDLAPQFLHLPVNEYPDTSYYELSTQLSRYTGKNRERLVVTNGADEALDIVSKVFLNPSDEVIIPYPTYSMFRIVSEIMGAIPIFVKRNADLSLNVEEIRKRISNRTRAIFLCSPNNPTGDTISEETARGIIELTDATVVIDEAYFEFCGKTLASLTEKYENVVIIRTFSKAFSMAGVRVGYAIGCEGMTKALNLVRPPNSLGVISLALAQSALRHRQSMRENVRQIMSERKRVSESMGKLNGLRVYPGEANFILFKVGDQRAKKLCSQLLKRGFVLRDFSETRGLEGCLRVTISTKANNDDFLENLRALTERS